MPFYSSRLEATIHEPLTELWKDFKLWRKMSKQDWVLFKEWQGSCLGTNEIFCINCGCLVPIRYVNLRTSGFNYTPDTVVKWLKLPIEELMKHLSDRDPLVTSVVKYRFYYEE